jgi:hypothetical protein
MAGGVQSQWSLGTQRRCQMRIVKKLKNGLAFDSVQNPCNPDIKQE